MSFIKLAHVVAFTVRGFLYESLRTNPTRDLFFGVNPDMTQNLEPGKTRINDMNDRLSVSLKSNIGTFYRKKK